MVSLALLDPPEGAGSLRTDDSPLPYGFSDAPIGLALSDPLGITAQPVGKIDSRGPTADLRQVLAIIAEHQAVEVVVAGLVAVVMESSGSGGWRRGCTI